MAFHTKDGWCFERQDDASVRVFRRVAILKPDDKGDVQEIGYFESTSFLLPAETWISAVGHVARGHPGKDVVHSIDLATRLHFGR